MNIQPQWLAGLIGVIAPLLVRWITGAAREITSE